MTPAQLNRKLAYLPSKVNTIAKRALKDNDKEIIRRVQEQLSKGEDGNGKLQADGETAAYGGYRDKSHTKQRRRRGLQTTFVDLKFNGSFERGMFVKFDGLGMSLGSSDKKSDILVGHWGADIFALNDDNFDWLLDKIVNSLYTELTMYFS